MIHKTTRSILSVLLAALLLVTSTPLTPAFADGGAVSLQSESGEGRALDGDGTKDNPYKISSAAELEEFRDEVNSGKTDAWAELTADIDLSEICSEESDSSWTPIGNEDHRYTGTFDGNGKTIENLYINNTTNAEDQGLFGYVGTGGTVQNLSVSGSVKGDDYVGGVVGYNDEGRVENCHNIGSVSGDRYVGGVVGDNRGTVKNCHNIGEVSGNNYVGGVVGDNDGGRVENCYNTGSVSGNRYVGGVVGDNSGRVTNCYNTGSVSGPDSGDSNRVGGVVGYNSGTVENCYNTGTVTGPDIGYNNAVGGVVGYNSSSGNVTNCYNTGTVTGPDSGSGNSVGGVVGLNNSTVTGCYFLQQGELQGIGDGSGTTGATAVTTLDALCENFENDNTNTWTISDILNRPVLKDNHEDDGTKDHPYEIFTATQLENFRDLVNRENGNPAAWAVLMENITLNSSEEWTPIGSFSNSYEGTFDGNGKTIENLYINNTSSDYQGLFGYVSGSGKIENLSVSGSVSGNNYVGGVVGLNRGSVEDCDFTGSVSGSYYVGGVVGENSGSVINCTNTDSVKGSGIYVGGVVGSNSFSATVTNCYNTGNVSGPDSGSGNSVGGVVGYNDSSASVANCYNTGTVSDGTTSGGVVGQNFGSGSVTNCYFLPTADVNKNLSGIGSGTGTATEKDDTAFHSGEVAHLLGEAWGQSALGTDNSWPTLVALDNSAKTVYKVTVDYNYDGAQNKTTYTNDPAKPAAPAREGYTFGGWDKTGEGTTTITYTAKWTENAPDPDPEPTPEPEPEEPPYSGKYSYEIATDIGDNGALSVDRYATEGDTVTIQVTPDQAYKLDDLSVTANGKDVELTANSDGTFSFTMPSADVKISATFAEDPDWTPDEPEEPATDVSDIFLDVAPNAWYKDAIQYAYDHGLMTGVSATEFAPEATTTRAMIVSILARLEGVTTAQAAGFADVNDEWYATAVNWAANVGVVNGYEDNTFRPNTAITREQLAAILMNYAAYKGEDVSNRADLTTYTDQPSTWATETMSWAVAEGLISGVTADTLQPQGAATRAQVAAILQRFLSE